MGLKNTMPKKKKLKKKNRFARSKKKEHKRRQKLKEQRKSVGIKIKMNDPKKQKIAEQIVSKQIESKRQRMKRISLLLKGKAITKQSLSKNDKNKCRALQNPSIIRKVMNMHFKAMSNRNKH